MFETLKTLFSRPKAAATSGGLTTGDIEWIGINRSDAGIAVNVDNALRQSTVMACVRLISSAVASLPIHLYRRRETYRERVLSDPTLQLLNRRPNQMMTGFTFKEITMLHLLMRGNAYARIVWSKGGKPIEILPLDPDTVEPFRKGGRMYYAATRLNGGKEILDGEEVLHVPGLGYDGLKGYDPITYASNAIGNTIATERYGASFFRNGGRPNTVLLTDKGMTPQAQREFLQSFNEHYRGVDNANKTGLLVDGMKLQDLQVNNEQAQFLESRNYNVTDICRLFLVPPHMVGQLDKSSFNNIEHQGIGFVRYTLRTWMDRIEAEYDVKLMGGDDALSYGFDEEPLLKADFNTRMDGYSKAINCGHMTINETRAIEGNGPVEGGDTPRVPVNTAPADLKSNSKEPAA